MVDVIEVVCGAGISGWHQDLRRWLRLDVGRRPGAGRHTGGRRRTSSSSTRSAPSPATTGASLARPAAEGGAQPSIDAGYLIFSGGFAPTPELAAAVGEQAQAVKDALAAWHARYDYYNFVETPAAASAVLPPASYQRLQKIKTSYDPDQMIISAHPVWPTRP